MPVLQSKAKTLICLVYFLFSVCSAAHSSEQPEDVFAFINVNVIPMDRERIIRNQTVIVQDSRIYEIGPASTVKVPDRAEVIDGRGKYLMPGLADMHVHLGTDDPDELVLFLANGVTTVRNMWGLPVHLEWRTQIKDRELLGPTIYTTGPIVDGNPAWWPGSTVIETPEQAEKEVLAEKQMGYDGIKVFSNLQPAVYQAILNTAKRHDFPVYGHVPTRLGFEKALAEGQRSFEHMSDFMYALLPDNSPFRAGLVEAFSDMSKRNLESVLLGPYTNVDEMKIPTLVAKAADAGAWICPTLVMHLKQAANAKEFKAFRDGRCMKYVAPEHWVYWDRVESGFLSDQGAPATMKHGFEIMHRAVKALHEAGVRLLIGTDTPNPFVVPGFSIHEELQNFVDAGFTPFEVIKAATRDAAKFLDATDEFGTIDIGRSADLIMVEANPLEDVENVARRVGVMVRGRWYSESNLQTRLEALAKKYSDTGTRSKDPPPEGVDNE